MTSPPAAGAERRGTVLVVDDDPAMRVVCGRLLSEMGLSVEQAEGREEAWAALAGASFDLVLTDIQMGSATAGISLTEEIKSRSPRTDVIVMTGQPTLETAVACLKSGASDYVDKPFDLLRLRSVVQHCLEKRRLLRELNQERALQAELRAAYSELQKVERLKDAFLGRINHELRTPVAVALLAVGAVECRLAGEEERKLWSKLDGAVKNLKSVVEELVLYAKLARGDFAPARERTCLRGLIEELVARHEPLWRERRLQIDLALQGLSEPVLADAALLREAFRHLLANAIRFSRNGGSVRVEGESSSGAVLIRFVDSGIGIPEDRIGDVFDSFYQVADHMTRESGGLGLGLATVRKIVEAHGGGVSARSRPGEGSEFVVTLPAGVSPTLLK